MRDYGSMLYADYRLARRLERAEALGAAACADAEAAIRPSNGAACLSIGSARAAFHGLSSPLTQAVGLGFDGPVTPADLDKVEEFFHSRGSAAVVHLCPLADPSLADLLIQRQYRISEFNNVLVRSVRYGEMIPPAAHGITVRAARRDEAERWARQTLHGFLGREVMSEAEYAVGHALFHSAMPWMAESGAEFLGGGAFSVHEGLGCFFADATLPAARNRGVQTALIRGRLKRALERGCDLATASTQPGSVSQRNYETCGFRVMYTKLIMHLDRARSPLPVSFPD